MELTVVQREILQELINLYREKIDQSKEQKLP